MRTIRSTSRLLGAGGVSAQGVSAQGVVCLGGRGNVWQTPPMDRMTDACENITLSQLRCGR